MSRTFWDRAAGLYDLFEWSNRKVNAAARTRVGELVPAGARVLDCAAGTGEFSLAAAKRAGSVLCTDQSEAMLRQARKKAARKGLKNVSFAQRDIACLPFPDGSLDAAASDILREIFPDKMKAGNFIIRIYTLLRKNRL